MSFRRLTTGQRKKKMGKETKKKTPKSERAFITKE